MRCGSTPAWRFLGWIERSAGSPVAGVQRTTGGARREASGPWHAAPGSRRDLPPATPRGVGASVTSFAPEADRVRRTHAEPSGTAPSHRSADRQKEDDERSDATNARRAGRPAPARPPAPARIRRPARRVPGPQGSLPAPRSVPRPERSDGDRSTIPSPRPLSAAPSCVASPATRWTGRLRGATDLTGCASTAAPAPGVWSGT